MILICAVLIDGQGELLVVLRVPLGLIMVPHGLIQCKKASRQIIDFLNNIKKDSFL